MEISKEFRFEAAHRLRNHAGKCKNLHGHSYRLDLAVRGSPSPATCMVLDFGDLEKIVAPLVDLLDPATIVSKKDLVLRKFLAATKSKTYVLKTTGAEPTAEVLAAHIAARVSWLLPPGLDVASCTVWETAKCKAVWTARTP